jgi:hypothetical protein
MVSNAASTFAGGIGSSCYFEPAGPIGPCFSITV